MTSLQTPTVRVGDSDQDRVVSSVLAQGDADTYAQWFACLAEPMRVRLLHRVASAFGGITVGALAGSLGIGQPTVSHHLRKLSDVGFVTMRKEGTSTVVAMNPTCCVALPQAADVVMGVLAPRPCCPSDLPDDVTVRAMADDDWDAVLRIYGEGIDTRNATFATEVPAREHLQERWLSQHRWVATIEGVVVGWAALSPVSERDCYRGVAENSVHVADGMRGRGVGKALLRKQVMAADVDDLWTLQTSIFPENRASISLHHSAGFRTVGLREKIAQLDGVWRDTVLLERRAVTVSD
ncbi:metalloregulator ArsR/SmtB family transcription factor [Rhodococcus sp. IEGM 1409]|uniref:helix-turn-helix domain-containing GNAT family N-acetyltransferase n=1 Tax=Rhodococcus sp. IEGM 1409 TaxID=3047082 RepID=UPI0024B63A20|nr:metalloregulator ArsR/SmtB family transcription factor [Rhodococcus sp. IEGM 1409]MDI9900672.1 metalloregulator ArsR/SmtB family transcription factor [Rhodococcus sp. IEGM 1409]